MKDAFGTPDFGPKRRGLNANRRGKAFERKLAAELAGGKRVGQFGGKEDVTADGGRWQIQAKVGTMFPERLYKWLADVPVEAGQRRALVVGDSPGPGRKRRTIVVLEFDEWRRAEGLEPLEEEAA